MNQKDKLTLALFENTDEKVKKTNPAINILDGAIYGAGVGFVAPGLVSVVAPRSAERLVKEGKVFGGDIAQQMIDSDRDMLYAQKQSELNRRVALGEKLTNVDYDNAFKQAAEEAKGFVKKPLNTNLFIQSGVGRWGAGIGASVVGVNMLRKRLNRDEKKS